MPQQLPLRPESLDDLLAKKAHWAARQTYPLGNEALGRAVGCSELHRLGLAIGEAREQGDEDAVRRLCREWCEQAKEVING